jgi:hypothetical protein
MNLGYFDEDSFVSHMIRAGLVRDGVAFLEYHI